MCSPKGYVLRNPSISDACVVTGVRQGDPATWSASRAEETTGTWHDVAVGRRERATRAKQRGEPSERPCIRLRRWRKLISGSTTGSRSPRHTATTTGHLALSGNYGPGTTHPPRRSKDNTAPLPPPPPPPGPPVSPVTVLHELYFPEHTPVFFSFFFFLPICLGGGE